MNSVARERTAFFAASTDSNSSSALITLLTAFGSETAVGLVSIRIPAAFFISCLNTAGSDTSRLLA